MKIRHFCNFIRRNVSASHIAVSGTISGEGILIKHIFPRATKYGTAKLHSLLYVPNVPEINAKYLHSVLNDVKAYVLAIAIRPSDGDV